MLVSLSDYLTVKRKTLYLNVIQCCPTGLQAAVSLHPSLLRPFTSIWILL